MTWHKRMFLIKTNNLHSCNVPQPNVYFELAHCRLLSISSAWTEQLVFPGFVHRSSSWCACVRLGRILSQILIFFFLKKSCFGSIILIFDRKYLQNVCKNMFGTVLCSMCKRAFFELFGPFYSAFETCESTRFLEKKILHLPTVQSLCCQDLPD